MHADDTTREYMTSKVAKIQVGLLGIFFPRIMFTVLS